MSRPVPPSFRKQITVIEPRTLKGFRDLLPAQALARERILDIARRVYQSYGFAPIDTPALEYLEILTGKGSDETDKQLYRFVDHGGRSVGLRFDLTVPFARFAAQHVAEIGLPFKRYHMAPVWRGENTQRGRYREFMQCDFDTIGTTSAVSDLETVLVVHDLLVAIGIEKFSVCVNDRRVLTGVLEQLGISDCATAVLRSLDKLAKVPAEQIRAELIAIGVSDPKASRLLEMAGLRGDSHEVLSLLEGFVGTSEIGLAGLAGLRGIVSGSVAAGVPEGRVLIDPSIARGLDYYTGIVIESFLEELPAIGSICYGGRYDNLAGLYTKESLPGVGASLGLDRLLAALEELERIETTTTPAEVFIVYFDSKRLEDYIRIASAIRAAGMNVELYPEPKRVGQQLKYADRKGFRIAIVAGANEFETGTVQIKHLASQSNSIVDWHGDMHILTDAVHSALQADQHGHHL